MIVGKSRGLWDALEWRLQLKRYPLAAAMLDLGDKIEALLLAEEAEALNRHLAPVGLRLEGEGEAWTVVESRETFCAETAGLWAAMRCSKEGNAQ